jgi:hypothetical protein
MQCLNKKSKIQWRCLQGAAVFLPGRVQGWGRGSAGREAVPGSYQPLRPNTGEGETTLGLKG